MAYHDNQPFNENHYRPCPMLENPEILQKMVKETGAKSTDLQSPETAEHLCSKCVPYANAWKPYADKIRRVAMRIMDIVDCRSADM